MIEWHVTVEYPDTSVEVTIFAPTLREATELVHERVKDPGSARPLGLHIKGTPPIAVDLLDAAGVREALGGISQHTLARIQGEPGFPEPVARYGGGRGVWSRAAIEQYAAANAARSAPVS
jgi:hypothetical protein